MSGFSEQNKDTFGNPFSSHLSKTISWAETAILSDWGCVAIFPPEAGLYPTWVNLIDRMRTVYGENWWLDHVGFSFANLLLKAASYNSYNLDYELWVCPVYPPQPGNLFETLYAFKSANGSLVPGAHYAKTFIEPYNLIFLKVRCAQPAESVEGFFSMQAKKV